MDKLKIYVDPPRRPLRLPPDYRSPDRLNGERMIGAVVIGICVACMVGTVIWFFRGHA
jgi:hypothetical protein